MQDIQGRSQTKLAAINKLVHIAVGESFSYDGGRTWTDLTPSSIKHTNSRFHISRLKSGRLLLVKHSDEAVEGAGLWEGRRDLTAYLSDDDTWQLFGRIKEPFTPDYIDRWIGNVVDGGADLYVIGKTIQPVTSR